MPLRAPFKGYKLRDTRATVKCEGILLSGKHERRVTELLKVSTLNNQVCNAGLCAYGYLPPLLASHGHLLDAATKKDLADKLSRYNR